MGERRGYEWSVRTRKREQGLRVKRRGWEWKKWR
jgi:hypothetical protein